MPAERNNKKNNKKNNMAKKTEKRGANKVHPPQKLNINLESMNFWRDLARQVCPDVKDDFELGEVAVILQETSKHLSNEQERISKICNKNADTQIRVGLQIGIDRRVTPSEVSVKIGYSEKYGATIKAQVPDPNQDQLPGLVETSESGEGVGGAELGDPVGEKV